MQARAPQLYARSATDPPHYQLQLACLCVKGQLERVAARCIALPHHCEAKHLNFIVFACGKTAVCVVAVSLASCQFQIKSWNSTPPEVPACAGCISLPSPNNARRRRKGRSLGLTSCHSHECGSAAVPQVVAAIAEKPASIRVEAHGWQCVQQRQVQWLQQQQRQQPH